jgi:hypothetical protein
MRSQSQTTTVCCLARYPPGAEAAGLSTAPAEAGFPLEQAPQGRCSEQGALAPQRYFFILKNLFEWHLKHTGD